jgi:hypothetical protein
MYRSSHRRAAPGTVAARHVQKIRQVQLRGREGRCSAHSLGVVIIAIVEVIVSAIVLAVVILELAVPIAQPLGIFFPLLVLSNNIAVSETRIQPHLRDIPYLFSSIVVI